MFTLALHHFLIHAGHLAVACHHHRHHHRHRFPLGTLCQYGYRRVVHFGGHPRRPLWVWCIPMHRA